MYIYIYLLPLLTQVEGATIERIGCGDGDSRLPGLVRCHLKEGQSTLVFPALNPNSGWFVIGFATVELFTDRTWGFPEMGVSPNRPL